ncbi:MAG: rod shape-determining protein [Alphaproteobacteria bacterium]|nr:rod shape-determining protein [Rickettsiales bacterium]
MFSKFRFGISKDLAIDLGTANTLIFEKDKGVVINQPSMVAVIREKGYEIPYLFGDGAKQMAGKTPLHMSVYRPLQDGVIADFRVAEEMIRHFVNAALGKRIGVRATIIVCVPFEATDVEKRAIQTAVEKCSVKEVFLIEEPMAAAIGAGLPVNDPFGSMIVDIGGGTSEIAIISLGGVVHGRSVKIGGDAMDRTIIQYVRQKYNLLIGSSTAEKIKKEIGVAILNKNQEPKKTNIRGRDLLSGTPREIIISETDMGSALAEPVSQIVEAVRIALEAVPPELASDIVDRGIVLTGGGAMLKNMDLAISRATNLPVFIAPFPLYCVAIGAGKVLSNKEKHMNILFKQG